jgi:hypothetical protein
VFAAGEAIVVIAMSASIAVGGPLIEAAGPRAAYALTGVLGVLATVTIWWGAWELHTQKVAADARERADGGDDDEPGRRAPGDLLEAASSNGAEREEQELSRI